MPATESASLKGSIDTLNLLCMKVSATYIEGAIAPVGRDDINLQWVENTDRYALYRSAEPLVFITQTLEEGQQLPQPLPTSGYIFVQACPWGYEQPRTVYKGEEIKGQSVDVLTVEIFDVERGPDMPDSVSPDNEDHEVWVSIYPPGQTIQFDIAIKDDDPEKNGKAIVTGNASRTTSGDITIQGTVQTEPDHAGNIRIRATFTDGNIESVFLSDGFSVCAHPCDFTCVNQQDINANRYGFSVTPDWESDSKNTNDLTRVILHEKMKYPPIPNPPFLRPHPRNYINPSIPFGVPGNILPPPDDDHEWRKNQISCPPGGGFTADQTFEFFCRRCMRNPRNVKEWSPLASYQIKREVKLINEIWYFIVTQTGPGGPFSRTQRIQ